MRRTWRTVILVGALGVSSACAASQTDVEARESQTVVEASGTVGTASPSVPDNSVDSAPIATTPEPSTTDGSPSDDEVAEIIAELTEAGFCDPADVENEGLVTAMHFVVRGVIQEPCYVDQLDDDDENPDNTEPVVIDDDPRLLATWNLLDEIAPIELIDDISLFAGYERCSDCETLAFVTQLDEAGAFFVVAVDVVAASDDPDEMRLTMMHELTHVFAQIPDEQLVVTSNAEDCETFYNGVGCFTVDSYIWAWIQDFWPPELLAELPTDGSVASDEEAQARCDADAAYTGAYAATHPEEDFAETFSAYVFDVEVDAALRPKLEFFDRYPLFVEMRERARENGYASTEASFEACGN